MRRKGDRPETRTRQPEPRRGSVDWVVWAAWADRVSFEDIEEQTGLTEADVIKVMRKELSPTGFRRWRARVGARTTKHRRLFKLAANKRNWNYTDGHR